MFGAVAGFAPVAVCAWVHPVAIIRLKKRNIFFMDIKQCIRVFNKA